MSPDSFDALLSMLISNEMGHPDPRKRLIRLRTGGRGHISNGLRNRFEGLLILREHRHVGVASNQRILVLINRIRVRPSGP